MWLKVHPFSWTENRGVFSQSWFIRSEIGSANMPHISALSVSHRLTQSHGHLVTIAAPECLGGYLSDGLPSIMTPFIFESHITSSIPSKIKAERKS